MSYDIPDEITYTEKLAFGLGAKQILYGIVVFILVVIEISNLEGYFGAFVALLTGLFGIGFILFNWDVKVLDRLNFYRNMQNAPYFSKTAQKFYEIKEVKDNYLFLDDGSVIGILEVQPINFNFLDEDKQKSILAQYKHFLHQISLPVQILVRTHKVSLDDYFEQIEKIRKTENELLTMTYIDFREFMEEEIKRNNILERRFFLILRTQEKESQQLENLQQLLDIIKDQLNVCGLETKQLENEKIFDLLKTYSDDAQEESLNFESVKGANSFREAITPSFRITPTEAIINGEFHRIFKLTGYPRKVTDGWLQSFLSKNENFDISLHIHPMDIQSNLIYIDRKINEQSADLYASQKQGMPNLSLEIKRSDTMEIYRNIYQGLEKLFRFSMYIDAKSITMQELEILTKKSETILKSHLMVSQMPKYRLADAVKSTLPIAKDQIEASREILSNALTATFPFTSPTTTKKKGTFFAFDVETLNPIFLDAEEAANKHYLVVGISGAGKSYTVKSKIANELMIDDKIKILITDPNGEYGDLVKILDGQVIKISRNSDSVINIFDLAGQNLAEKKLNLFSAFDILVGGVTEPQKDVLSEALDRLYEKKGFENENPDSWTKKPPIFSDMKKILEEMRNEGARFQDSSAEVLLNRVKKYCKGSVFGFLDAETEVDMSKNIVSFDLSSLPEVVRRLMMFAVLEITSSEIKKNRERKMVVVDEGWELLRSKEVGNYLTEFARASRKYNASFGFITQQIEDLSKNEAGNSILHNTPTKILLKQNSTNINILSKMLNLNDNTKKFLLGAKAGQGVLITDNNVQKFQVRASKKLHELITTNPEELIKKKEKEKVKKKEEIPVGIDLERGVYLASQLSLEQKAYLMKNGYGEHKDRLNSASGSSLYLVKIRHNEGKTHAFLCWSLYHMIKDKFPDAKINIMATHAEDISLQLSDGRNIAFEVETGTNLSRDEEGLARRLERLKQGRDALYIIVTKWQERKNYKKYGTVLVRDEIPKMLEWIQSGFPREYNPQSDII